MCAIAGIYSPKTYQTQLALSEVRSMLDSMKHRGPDGEGIKKIGNKVVIGNRRLAIVDRKLGIQPLSNEKGNLWITFNGEIYNHNQLREELVNKQHIFKTQTDTEVILHGYEEYGVGVLSKLNGMFAFRISDGRHLFLARDRLGVKPLFFRIEKGVFRFASEMKAIVGNKEKFKLNGAYLTTEAFVHDRTIFPKVFQLLPGHYVIFNGNSLKVSCYWNLVDNVKNISDYREKQLLEHLRWLIIDSVALRVPKDLDHGVFVSGGLDSAVIACLSKPQYLFTSVVDNDKYKEDNFVEELAKFTGVRLIKIYPDIPEFVKNVSKIVWYLDEPVTTLAAFPLFQLSQIADKYVKVILNGQGGDELFGGYIRYLMLFFELVVRQCQQLEGYEPLAMHFWGKLYSTSLAERYYQLVKRSQYNDKNVSATIIKCFESFPKQIVAAAGYADLLLSFPSLLRADDRLTMAWGVESRSPLLDYRILEFAFSLPDELKIKGKGNKQFTMKYLLREAMKTILPKIISSRIDKIGFPSPVAMWLNHELDPMMRKVIGEFRAVKEFLPLQNSLEPMALGEYNRSKWQILQLTIWHSLFIQGLSHHEIYDRYLKI